MSRRDDRVTLAQMLDTAREIEAAVHGRTLDELRTNRMFELALLHLFVQLGETSRRITSEGRTQHAAIPWHQINGMRNWVVHLYDRVDLALVWSTATRSIPLLVDDLERILR
jgi:uncharacterized protein with HEPN domain